MSTDLEERLAAILQARAGEAVDPAELMTVARRRGRRLQARRRGWLLGGVAAVCAALVGTVLLIPMPDRAPAALLPAAGNVPGAATRPALVGTDPSVIHFSTDEVTAGATQVTVSTGDGIESVEWRAAGRHARVAIAQDAAALDDLRQTLASSGRPEPTIDIRVADRPGIAWRDPVPSGGYVWFVRWRPADGLWAQLDIDAGGADEAVDVAAGVRFDAAHRCAVPFRLTTLPAGASVLACSVQMDLRAEPGFAEGELIVGDGSGRRMTVAVQRVPPEAARWSGGALRAGPHQVRRLGRNELQTFVEPCFVYARSAGPGAAFAESAALTVLGGYRPVGDVDRPGTW